MKPEEKQWLILLLSDLAGKVQELEAERDHQARDIEDLKKELSEMHETVISIRDFSREAIGRLKSEVASCNQLLEQRDGPPGRRYRPGSQKDHSTGKSRARI